MTVRRSKTTKLTSMQGHASQAVPIHAISTVSLMHPTRRRLLRAPLLLALAGCTPSPVVQGDPSGLASVAPATRTPAMEAVAMWLTGFATLADELVETADAWTATDVDRVWLTAVQGQCAAHLSRLGAEDPVVGGPTVFPAPPTDGAAAAVVADGAGALGTITAAVDAGTPIFHAAQEAAGTQQERLLVTALMTAATASVIPSLPPFEGPASPSPFEDVTTADALAVSLGHARALIRGLELGLGRLDTQDPLQAPGAERLATAKELRNALLDAMEEELPEVDSWALPNAMTTAPEIQAAWAVLETNLLDAFSILVAAAGSPGETPWQNSLLAQVDWVHRWGGRLPYWPGWVATP